MAVRLTADHPLVLRCADRLFGIFPALRRPAAAGIRLAFTALQQWEVPEQAQALPPSSHEVIDPKTAYGIEPRFLRLGSINYYSFAPLGSAAYDLGRGICVVGLRNPDVFRPWLMEHLVLQVLVLELLRGRNLFWLHAGCVAHHGKAVLFTGQSGSGKTTSCLNLAVHGFDFLADDRVWIRVSDREVTLRAYPRDLAITSDTLALLPSFQESVGPRTLTSRKLRIPAATLFPGRLTEAVAPGLIFFPQVTNNKTTVFQPLPPTAALCRILPNSLLASHQDVSARHFQALSALIRGSRAYDVLLGQDVGSLPDQVLNLLARPRPS